MFKDLYLVNKKNTFFYNEKFFKEKYPIFYIEICNFISKNNLENLPFKVKIYHYLHNLENIPICKVCQSPVKFNNFNCGYRSYCSNNCVNNSPLVKEKMKKTFLSNYGVDNPSKDTKIKEKTKKTNLERYGTTCNLLSDECKNKTKKTNLKKYKVENVFSSEEIKEKIKKTNLQKYGVEFSGQVTQNKEKTKKTNLEKYGVTSYSKTEDFKKTLKDKNHIKLINKIGEDYKLVKNLKENKFRFLHKSCNKKFTISRDLLNLRYSREHELCLNCNKPSNQSSHGEIEISKFLDNLGIKYLHRDKKLISPYELDFFIPKFNVGIEFHGIYFHSNKFKKNNYHYKKWEISKEKNITLLQIFSDEWYTKKEIVKSVIKTKLGIFEQKIYGRKCVIKNLNSTEYSKFLDSNHLQGNCNSKYKIGLYYNEELVSVIGLSKKRTSLGGKKNDDGGLEIVRFSNKINTQVIGGFSKLLSYIKKNIEFNHLITYSDLRYFNGLIYEKNGFKFKHQSKPNYWYVDTNGKRYHRYNFAKHKLVKMGYDKNLSESTIMKNLKYKKIWDCGNFKWVLFKML